MKTILYLIGFYFLIKFLARIFLPILMKSMVNKVQENFNKQQGAYNQQQSQDSQTAKKENPKPTKQIGDYVDYEEVE